MVTKTQPIGICDNCLEPIKEGKWYTNKGKPRLYCSVACRNTANSQAGAAIRSEKARQRVASGQWQNPASLNPPDPAKIAAGISRARKQEVKEGRWRNPALSEEARKKLSRPRKHSDPLHRAIEKLRQGMRVAELTPEEQEAHRAYRRQLRQARRDEVNQWYRDYYHRRQAQMTPEEREEQRAKWRAANRRRAEQRNRS